MAASWIVTVASTGHAQLAALTEVYGRGVHAFHSHQYQESYELLSLAIDNGLKDPRAYYFRGFAASYLGLLDEVEEDFRMGAVLEARLGFGPVVGRALIRIQGSQRLQLESIRDRVRLQTMVEGQQRSEIRRQELGMDSPAGPTVPPATPPGSANLDVPAPPAPAAENPFADDMSEPQLESDDILEGVMDDPLASGETSEAAPPAAAGADPFGSDPAADNPLAPAGSDDPFAPAASDDPFAPADDGGAMDNDPFGGSDPFGSDDPFGN